MGKECNINYLVCYTTEEMCLQHNTTTYFISDDLILCKNICQRVINLFDTIMDQLNNLMEKVPTNSEVIRYAYKSFNDPTS